MEVLADRSLIWLSLERQIQGQMLVANHWTERRVPDRGVGEGTEEAEGVCSPMEGATVSTGQISWSSWGLNHQSKNIHGGTRGAG